MYFNYTPVLTDLFHSIKQTEISEMHIKYKVDTYWFRYLRQYQLIILRISLLTWNTTSTCTFRLTARNCCKVQTYCIISDSKPSDKRFERELSRYVWNEFSKIMISFLWKTLTVVENFIVNILQIKRLPFSMISYK